MTRQEEGGLEEGSQNTYVNGVNSHTSHVMMSH